MRKTVITITGPTAVGKTKLSIELAKRFNGEIISGDSMQVYKGMDIGTAKITDEEKQGIAHHMIDIKRPDEVFSAADFQFYVQKYIDEITSRGKLPIIVGGSGLYIQAALYDYHFSKQKRNDAVTQRLEKVLADEGSMALYQHLKEIDPEQAAKTHPNNHRRVIRALEIYETTGTTMTENQQTQSAQSPYNPVLIGLNMEREHLYKRINYRVDLMLENGLIDEVSSLYKQGFENCQSMKAIGYKELIPYLKGEQTIDVATELLKRNSRRYAKRQYTWFRNKMDVTWYTVNEEKKNEEFCTIFHDLAGILKNK